MTTIRNFALAAAFVLAGSTAWAMDSDDVTRMAKARVGDDVIVAQIHATKARFVLTADDIVRLKKDGVSDAVLKAMIETAKPEPKKESSEPARSGAGAQEAPAVKVEPTVSAQPPAAPETRAPSPVVTRAPEASQPVYVQPPPPAPAQPQPVVVQVVEPPPPPPQVIEQHYYTVPAQPQVYYVPSYSYRAPVYYRSYPRAGCYYYGPGIYGRVGFRVGGGRFSIGLRL
jgi:hypothetical protein